MTRRWLTGGLAVAAVGAAVGLLRSGLMLETPPAAELPAALVGRSPQLPGYRSLAEPSLPPWRGRDRADSTAWRWRLVPRVAAADSAAVPLRLEWVVSRSRQWRLDNLALPASGVPERQLRQMRLRRLGARQQVGLGLIEGRPALQTCLVGRGRGESGPAAAVEDGALQPAWERWRDRLDPAITPGQQLLRVVAIQAGLRASHRWECLLVTLTLERGRPWDRAADEALLMRQWTHLAPQLQAWGEQWDGVGF